MKAFLLTFASLVSLNAVAQPNCKYELKHEDYASNASGTLTINAQSYKCKTMILGQEGDQVTACMDKAKKKQKPAMYDFIVAFDGAEADFFVSTDVKIEKVLCKGKATVKASDDDGEE